MSDLLHQPMIAIGYIRVSTDDQALSVAMQRDRLYHHCLAKGWILAEVVVEEGVSGKLPLMRRPKGKTVFRLMEEHKANILVAYKLDRLFRNTSDALTIADRLKEQGVDLSFIVESIDTTTAQGRLFYTIIAAFAEMERATISERVKAALDHKRGQGEAYGQTPLGYRRDGKRLVPVMSERLIVEQIRSLREEGVSYRKIAALLNDAGIPTKQRSRKPRGSRGQDVERVACLWQPSTVRLLVQRAGAQEAGSPP